MQQSFRHAFRLPYDDDESFQRVHCMIIGSKESISNHFVLIYFSRSLLPNKPFWKWIPIKAFPKHATPFQKFTTLIIVDWEIHSRTYGNQQVRRQAKWLNLWDVTKAPRTIYNFLSLNGTARIATCHGILGRWTGRQARTYKANLTIVRSSGHSNLAINKAAHREMPQVDEETNQASRTKPSAPTYGWTTKCRKQLEQAVWAFSMGSRGSKRKKLTYLGEWIKGIVCSKCCFLLGRLSVLIRWSSNI